MNEYVVYAHINKINGKKYIGITADDPPKRWANGSGYRRNKHFNDAIKKYGWDNFHHLIIVSGLDESEACEIERAMIRRHKSNDKRFGYNITDGGEHFQHSDESKKLMNARRKGKGRVKRTAEQIEHMKANHKGGGKKRSVICKESGQKYGSINDAARATGINKKQISGCCRHVVHYNTAGGLHWEFCKE